MGKEKATIYDYARMCNNNINNNINRCEDCPLGTKNNGEGMACSFLVRKAPDKANEIILKWIEEHPVKTRQDKFLEMFPNACMYKGAINICPCSIDCDYNCKNKEKFVDFDCSGCKKEYWLAEVEENE